MSDLTTQTWLEEMWDKHREEYIKFCNANNINADLSDFQIYLEENDLIPEEIYE